jgi:hypothetical protein
MRGRFAGMSLHNARGSMRASNPLRTNTYCADHVVRVLQRHDIIRLPVTHGQKFSGSVAHHGQEHDVRGYMRLLMSHHNLLLQGCVKRDPVPAYRSLEP